MVDEDEVDVITDHIDSFDDYLDAHPDFNGRTKWSSRLDIVVMPVLAQSPLK